MTRLLNADGTDVTEKTIGAVKSIVGQVGENGSLNDLQKATGTVTIASGLTAYDLEAPAKNLYPVLTPIRNRIPRKTKSTGAGTAANWKEVSAIAGNSQLPALPWVPEGQRSARMSITTADRSASYKTIGLEADVTFEAESAGSGFEDVLASSGTRLLQQTMILEEYALYGGNGSVDLATPATPVLSASGAGATLPTATYSVYVFALTYEGWLMATVAGGIKRQATITGMDGKTYTLNGGSSITSANATQAVTLGQTLFMSVTALKGAVAYAWYVGTAAAEKLEAITTINSYAITAPLAGTGQAYSAVSSPSSDYSKNATAFDGLLYHVFKSGSLAYYRALATGTAGTGTTLTASGRGSITEIDTMLRSFWDNYRLSPEEIYVHAQEMQTILAKIFGGTANGTLRYNIQLNGEAPQIIAGVGSILYPNPFGTGQPVIPIKVHPHAVPGTLLAWSENLPAQYVSSNVPQTAEVQCRRDYYQIPWPIITRARETGVYAEMVLKCYATFALGVIANIAPSS